MNTIALPYPTAADITAGKEAEAKREQFKREAKLQRAKAYLGINYVSHPAYQFTERHSPDLAIWWQHRSLRQVEDIARAAGRL